MITLSLYDEIEYVRFSFWVIIQSQPSQPNNAPSFDPIPQDFFL
jgi:hypothetical protein